MKRRTAVLVMVAILLVVTTNATIARSYLICPSSETKKACFHGFETDVQIGMPSPSFVGWDVGFLTQGYFNLGVGASLANIETRTFVGTYAKLGILSFDILKGKWMLNPNSNEWYVSCKIKAPFKLVPICENVIWPFSLGIQYVESNINQSRGHVYLQEFSPFIGIDVPINGGYAEFWIEFQSPHSHKIVTSRDKHYVVNGKSLQFEFGFSFCY